MRCLAFFLLTSLHKSPQNSNLIELMFSEVEIVILSQSQLIKVIIESLFGISNFLGGTFQCVNSFSFGISAFIKLSPFFHSIDGFFNCSFLDFLFLLLRRTWLFRTHLFRNKFSVMDSDVIFYKQLIWE